MPGEDILVMGFDNSEAGAKAKIPLSSVDADPILLGKQAVKYVMKLLKGEMSQSAVVPTRFVARESIGKIDDTVSYENDKLLDKLNERSRYFIVSSEEPLNRTPCGNTTAIVPLSDN